MFCPECGKKNSDDSRFCEFCGAELIQNTDTGSTDFDTSSESVGAEPYTEPYTNEKSGAVDGGEYTDEQSNGYYNAQDMAMENVPHTNEDSYQLMTVPEKKSKKSIVIAAELIVIAALAVLLFLNVKKECEPERVAEKYFQTYIDGNWKKLYKNVNEEESKFVNEKTFQSVVQLSDLVRKGSISKYSIDMKTKNSYTVEAIVTYMYKSNEEKPMSYKMTLKKTGKKKMLFFDDWEISYNFKICKDYSIYAPKNCSITVDGIDVEKNVSHEDENNGLIKYSIDKIYKGNHWIEVKMVGFQNVKEIVNFEDGDEYLPTLKLKEETVKEITDDAVKNMKKYIEVAAQGKDIADFIDVEQKEVLENSYSEFVDNYIKTYDEEEEKKVYPTEVNVYGCETKFIQLDMNDSNDDQYDQDTDEYIPSVGAVYIKAGIEKYYPVQISENGEFINNFDQTYYYGFKNGKLSLVRIR